ncbi:MAG: hypothetical protein ACETWG_01255 [Candidatus Neomarinimicrobiota bacterium]
MKKVISIHEYVLKPDVTDEQFKHGIEAARERKLFDLPGLEAYYFLKGIRGANAGTFAAIWVYKDRKAWEHLWGSVGRAVPKEGYPSSWQIWEKEILAPLLTCDPDEIRFTSYQEI